MTAFLTAAARTVAGAAGRVIGTAASYGLNAMFPPPHRATDRLWADTHTRSREELLATHDDRVQALAADLKQQACEYAADTAIPAQLYPRLPRVIAFRGLDARERDAEWIDAQGDRWRWHAEQDGAAKSWHYLWMPGLPSEEWVEADPSADHAPYAEVIDQPEPELEPAATEPETPRDLSTLLLDLVGAVSAADHGRVSALAALIADEYCREMTSSLDLLNSIFGTSMSFDDLIAARTDESGPAAEDSPAPAVTPEPAGAGSLNLTARDLEDAARAVRSYILKLAVVDNIKSWDQLAEKLEAAALSK